MPAGLAAEDRWSDVTTKRMGISTGCFLTLILTIGVIGDARRMTDRTVLDGVFSAAQAERGRAAYAKRCSECHQPDLSGNGIATALSGAAFMTWEGENLDALFVRIRDTMPQGAERSLSDQVCLDIMTHILSVNGYPPGSSDLPLDLDVLKAITIVRPRK
jgi:hypothetical protein